MPRTSSSSMISNRLSRQQSITIVGNVIIIIKARRSMAWRPSQGTFRIHTITVGRFQRGNGAVACPILHVTVGLSWIACHSLLVRVCMSHFACQILHVTYQMPHSAYMSHLACYIFACRNSQVTFRMSHFACPILVSQIACPRWGHV